MKLTPEQRELARQVWYSQHSNIPSDGMDVQLDFLECFLTALPESGQVYIIFDGPPDHDSPRFIEVETARGESIRAGNWSNRGNHWSLGPFYTTPLVQQNYEIQLANQLKLGTEREKYINSLNVEIIKLNTLLADNQEVIDQLRASNKVLGAKLQEMDVKGPLIDKVTSKLDYDGVKVELSRSQIAELVGGILDTMVDDN